MQDLREIGTCLAQASNVEPSIPLEEKLRELVGTFQKHVSTCSACNNPMVRRW